MSHRETILPADPTPPLTERDLAELRIIASADAAFGLPHGPLLRRLVKEHAALTAHLATVAAAVRGWHEAMCEYREGDVRGSVDKVHRAEAALVATLAAPTEG